MFDLSTPFGDFGTPGSGKGWTFSVAQMSSPLIEVAAMYRNEVSVGAAPLVGDLYERLEVNFPGLGLRGGEFIQFGADTDQIPAGGTITPVPSRPALRCGRPDWRCWLALPAPRPPVDFKTVACMSGVVAGARDGKPSCTTQPSCGASNRWRN